MSQLESIFFASHFKSRFAAFENFFYHLAHGLKVN